MSIRSLRENWTKTFRSLKNCDCEFNSTLFFNVCSPVVIETKLSLQQLDSLNEEVNESVVNTEPMRETPPFSVNFSSC